MCHRRERRETCEGVCHVRAAVRESRDRVCCVVDMTTPTSRYDGLLLLSHVFTGVRAAWAVAKKQDCSASAINQSQSA